MRQLTFLIKPASSLCNLRCRYCFYADVSNHREVRNYGIMNAETSERLIDAAVGNIEKGGDITFAFQGGEPTMAGIDYFRHFTDYAVIAAKEKHINVSFTIQTNGILIDDEWCRLLMEKSFLVGLSMDGPEKYHDENRVDAGGNGSWEKVTDTAARLKEYGIDYNILCVLTGKNAGYPAKLWDFFLKNGHRYLQFIPCLPELSMQEDEYSLTPQLFCSFYTELFDLWRNEIRKGNYISVKLFDDLANMFVFRRLTACGLNGSCNLQYVAEADGSIYPCDFYVLDEYRLGNIREDPLDIIQEGYSRSGFHDLRKELPDICKNCKYINLCHGGCVRLRQSMYIRDSYCGYKDLLSRIGDPLINTIQKYFL